MKCAAYRARETGLWPQREGGKGMGRAGKGGWEYPKTVPVNHCCWVRVHILRGRKGGRENRRRRGGSVRDREIPPSDHGGLFICPLFLVASKTFFSFLPSVFLMLLASCLSHVHFFFIRHSTMRTTYIVSKTTSVLIRGRGKKN